MRYLLENPKIDWGDSRGHIGIFQLISHHIQWFSSQLLFYYITNEEADKEFHISLDVLFLGTYNQWEKKKRAGEHQKYLLGWKRSSANEIKDDLF